MTSRVISLVDMDCFYVQVEERDHPYIKGVPAAVVQYNSWKGGGIIAVNYEARAKGVTRMMRGDEAKLQCPNIQLIQVPILRGKANLTKYRDAGKEVIAVLSQFNDVVERASIDEAYLDLTETVIMRLKERRISEQSALPSTWVVGYPKQLNDDEIDKQVLREQCLSEWFGQMKCNNIHEDKDYSDEERLTMAAILCEEIRQAVLNQTGFKCSAGISHSKMLSKLACGLHKPNQQTVLPQQEVPKLWEDMPCKKVRNLGGKLGEAIKEDFKCRTMEDLSKLTLPTLQSKYDDKTAGWLFHMGKGIDYEKVTSRQLPKSIGCGKNFSNRDILNTKEKVQHWMLQLAEELSERLHDDEADNKRRARTITVSVRLGDDRFTTLSRSCSLPSYYSDEISKLGVTLIQHTNKSTSKETQWNPPIMNISIVANKFEDITEPSSASIPDLFKKAALKPLKSKIEAIVEDRNQSIMASTSIFSDTSTKRENVESVHQVIPSTTTSFFKNIMLRKKQEEQLIENDDSIPEDRDDSDSNLLELISQLSDEEEISSLDQKTTYQDEISLIDEKIIKKPPKMELFSKICNASIFTENSHDLDYNKNLGEKQILIKEMFPDLGNIDESVMNCLPVDLQTVARKLQAEYAPKETSKCKSTEVSSTAIEDTKVSDSQKDMFSDHHFKGDMYNISEQETKSNKIRTLQFYKQPKNDSSFKVSRPNDILTDNNKKINCHDKFIKTTKDKVHTEEDMINCSECGQNIYAFDMMEHLDYHMAVKLRKDQQNVSPSVPSCSTKTVSINHPFSRTGKKRGRKLKSICDASKVQKLDSFFKSK